jgi:hypothetical protein
MSWMKRKSFAVALSTMMVAAILGASLGVVAARQRTGETLHPNLNYIGGPMLGDVSPQHFVACLPAGSWKAVYTWDNRQEDQGGQRWLHYFSGVPAYVNSPTVSGITVIQRFAGIALIMNQSVTNPNFPDSSTETCN